MMTLSIIFVHSANPNAMSTYKKIGPTYILKNNKRSLENLVRHYLAKTDELEDKEGKVLRQMEVMQSAVTSLQGWNQKRMSQQLPQAQPGTRLANLGRTRKRSF